jgi:L-rhamnose isomerase
MTHTPYELARARYAALGVDTDAALRALDKIPISLHCWQGDDVRGFEGVSGELSGGIQSTGSYPGRAANADELRANMERALALIPGPAKVNLHAIYGEVAGVERDQIEPRHFAAWVDWAKEKGLGLDFNPTLFSHPKAADGLTLAHPDPEIRAFWIEHCKRCRRISASFGQALGIPSVMNLWIADGFKDIPADRLTPRKRLKDALDEIFAEPLDPAYHIDALESKLFGIGLESYTVGSHEFYMGYAAARGLALCLDTGHFHPTESIADKLSAASLFFNRLLLHVSRPVRWDSDHVVVLNEELVGVAQELVRHGLTERVSVGLDYFDGSIDRITAWAVGARNMRKALLLALLEPYEALKKAEYAFDFTRRLVLLEEFKSMPWGDVWGHYCHKKGVTAGLLG